MCGDMKFISSVDQDISRVNEAQRVRYPFQHHADISYIVPSIHVLFCLLYESIAPLLSKLPPKIALKHNADSAIIVTCEITINNLTCEIIIFTTLNCPGIGKDNYTMKMLHNRGMMNF